MRQFREVEQSMEGCFAVEEDINFDNLSGGGISEKLIIDNGMEGEGFPGKAKPLVSEWGV